MSEELMTEVALRLGTGADVGRMVELDRLCFEPMFSFSLRTMAGFAGQSNAITLLAERRRELLGFVLAHREHPSLYLVTIDVHPKVRRQGIAHWLLASLETHGRAAGVRELVLHVWRENAAARSFYEREQFLPAGYAPDFYGPTLDALVLRKQL